MKESLWGYYLVLLGITVSTIMIMVTNMTTTNQQDYYLLREVTNAAMIDSVDYSYYTAYGTIKINTEKFVENFLRRFSEGVSKTNTYRIDFYSIYENPPSVSIKVTSNTGNYYISGDETNIDVVNSIDAILESNNVITSSDVFYSLPYANCNSSKYISSDEGDVDYQYCQFAVRSKFNISKDSYIYNVIKEKLNKEELDADDLKKIKVSDVKFLSVMSTEQDIKEREEKYGSTYSSNRIGDANIPADKIKVESDDGNFYLGIGLKYNCLDSGKNTIAISDEGKPWNGSCLIGIKYRVNFYYDES